MNIVSTVVYSTIQITYCINAVISIDMISILAYSTIQIIYYCINAVISMDIVSTSIYILIFTPCNVIIPQNLHNQKNHTIIPFWRDIIIDFFFPTSRSHLVARMSYAAATPLFHTGSLSKFERV